MPVSRPSLTSVAKSISNRDAVVRWDIHDLESSNRQLAESIDNLCEMMCNRDTIIDELTDSIDKLYETIGELKTAVENLPDKLSFVPREDDDASSK